MAENRNGTNVLLKRLILKIATVFGGGVHGVGKSSMFSRMANKRGITHWSASGLIKAVKSDALFDDSKVVQDVANNQDLLVRGYHQAISGQKGLILLDGHFTLINKEGLVIEVPIATFKELRLAALTCVSEAPQTIYKRLMLRDGRAPSVDQINSHQEREVIAARNVANHLRIELLEIQSGDDEELAGLLARVEINFIKPEQP